MKTYLVGGAVRDRLLGVQTKDRDWVVIGASPSSMAELGYRQVGKDFPVFLHPDTKEEYALARTERKTGVGHTAFDFNISSKVTLEEDLERRDLTINAIAEDHNGNLIDPFGGLSDIKNRLLRHVSEAFIEDPLRVLRVARFYAKLAPFGFNISPDTLKLMSDVSHSSELNTLSAERIWQEFNAALATPSPEKFVSTLRKCGALKAILPELDALFRVPQPKGHPSELNTGMQALTSLQVSSGLSKETSVRYASLMHDVGRGLTNQPSGSSHPDHRALGLELLSKTTKRLCVPNEHSSLAALVCEHRIKMQALDKLSADELLSLIESLDAIRRPERFKKFMTVCEATTRARTGLENLKYVHAKFLSQIIEIISEVDVKALLHSRPDKDPRDLLRQHRLDLITTFITKSRKSV